ncbi:MAG: hypothetical protein Q4B85_00455 [Lachnospiraceae bacterium]|nr:hypothetical protein [Lachnospiraceae bacterium]
MNWLKYNLQRLMQGRYGVDSLGRFCLGASVLLLLLSGLLVRVPVLGSLTNTAGLLLLFYTYFRMFSRNIPKRYEENRRFQKKYNLFSRAAGDKTHRYYRCSCCGQTIRVPKGKGRIQITCPKCRNSFVKKT